MKHSCKTIDITNPATVYPWVLECLMRHKRRYDFRKFVCGYTGANRREIDVAIACRDNAIYIRAARAISEEACRQIKARNLIMDPVTFRTRIDPSSGKTRQIGNECPMQQVFDYIAVRSCNEIWRRRLVPQQIAGIKKRGAIYGTGMINRWIKADNQAADYARRHGQRYNRQCKYHVKLDVKQCYPSMRVATFMKLFRRDCGNPDILWLWEALLSSHRVNGYEGFMIGALCSQWACQYIMSFIYRHAASLHYVRRGREKKSVAHVLLQMDDILLIGPNRKQLKAAAEKAIQYAATLGLTVKPGWHICRLDETPIDIVGYRLHSSGKKSIRPHIFIRAKRAVKRQLCLRRARRVVSYKGYFIHSDSRLYTRRLRKKWAAAQKFISQYDRRENNENLLHAGT